MSKELREQEIRKIIEDCNGHVDLIIPKIDEWSQSKLKASDQQNKMPSDGKIEKRCDEYQNRINHNKDLYKMTNESYHFAMGINWLLQELKNH